MIYLMAGHTPKGLNQDPGAVGVGGKREADLTMELRDLTADILRRNNLQVWEDDDTHRLADVLKFVKSKEQDIVLDIHFNAGPAAATGVEVIVPDRSTNEEREMAREICVAFSDKMRIRNRGVKSEKDTARHTLAVMRPAGINILIEVCFISNPNDMLYYEAQKIELAYELAVIIEKYERIFA